MQQTLNQQLASISEFKRDRLVISPHPYNDESFLGYLMRLTKDNLYDNITWILRLARIQINPLGKLALISTNRPKDLAVLAQLTGVNKEILASLFYTPVNLQGQVNDYLIFGHPVPRYTLRLQRPKVCPLCLIEKPYARRMWDLAPITVCPIHQILLYDTCPTCSRKISWHRKSLSECRCGRDWRKDSPSIINEDELEVAKNIYARCEIPLHGTRLYRTDPLANLRLHEYLTSLFFIAGQFIGIMDTRGKRLATSLTNAEIHSLLHKANQVFQNWPNNFYSFLDWKRENTPDTRHERGLRRDFGQYKSALYVQLSADCYNFLRQAFEEYIATHWEGGYTTALSRLNENARRKKKYLTVVEAKNLLGLSGPTIRTLVRAGRLQAAKQPLSSKALMLVDAASAREFLFRSKDAISLKETQSKLGVHTQRVLELIESGLLQPLRGPVVDETRNWRFSNKEVTALLVRIEHAATLHTHFTKGLRFEFALRRMQRARAHCGTLVQAVLDGEISPKRKKGGTASLQSYLYSLRDITNYIHKRLHFLAGEVYSIPEAAKFLNTNPLALYFLSNKGILKTKRFPGLEGLGRLTTKTDLDEFNAAYFVLTRARARSLGTDTDYVLRLLSNEGIKPISGRSIDGGPQYVFKASDLAAIDLRRLVSKSRTHLQRYPKAMELSRIGDILEIDRKSTVLLVKNGFLKPRVRGASAGKEGWYYLSQDLVRKCEQKGIEYTSLLSVDVAARMIGVGPGAIRKAVKSGRLSAISGQHNEYGTYVKREDVEKQIKANQMQVGTREAAKMLGVSRGVLTELRKKGVINRLSNEDGFGRKRYLRKDVERVRDLRIS